MYGRRDDGGQSEKSRDERRVWQIEGWKEQGSGSGL